MINGFCLRCVKVLYNLPLTFYTCLFKEISLNLNLFALKNTRIPLRDLREGSTRFLIRFNAPDIFQSEGVILTGDITAEVEVTVMGTDILIQLTAQSGADMICDRCGDEFHRQLKASVKTLYSRKQDHCADSDEVRFLSPAENEIDVREDIRDAIAVSLPVKILCKESCKGLCPQCGAKLGSEGCDCNRRASDPRWDALKDISFDD